MSYLTKHSAPTLLPGTNLRVRRVALKQEFSPADPRWHSLTGDIHLSGPAGEVVALVKRLEALPLLNRYSLNVGASGADVTLELRASYEAGGAEEDALAPILALQRKALP